MHRPAYQRSSLSPSVSTSPSLIFDDRTLFPATVWLLNQSNCDNSVASPMATTTTHPAGLAGTSTTKGLLSCWRESCISTLYHQHITNLLINDYSRYFFRFGMTTSTSIANATNFTCFCFWELYHYHYGSIWASASDIIMVAGTGHWLGGNGAAWKELGGGFLGGLGNSLGRCFDHMYYHNLIPRAPTSASLSERIRFYTTVRISQSFNDLPLCDSPCFV